MTQVVSLNEFDSSYHASEKHTILNRLMIQCRVVGMSEAGLTLLVFQLPFLKPDPLGR